MGDPAPPRRYVKPTMEAIPRKKLEEKPVINEYVLKLTQNPIGLIKPASQTETVSGIQLIIPHPEKGFYAGKLQGDDAESIRRLFSAYYKELLLLFLRFMTNQPNDLGICGEGLNYFKGTELMRDKCGNIVAFGSDKDNPYLLDKIKNGEYTVIPVDDSKPIFSKEDFANYFKNDFENKGLYEAVLLFQIKNNRLIQHFFQKAPESLRKIKKEISQCGNTYYVVPVGYYEMFSSWKGGHQNLLILNKSTKEAIVIEPSFYGNEFDQIYIQSQGKRIKQMYTALLDKLDLPYKLVIPITTYPQAIADDTNCMFWTFLITITYFLNTGKFTPNEISTAIINKYRTKESLIDYIEGFKVYLYDYADAFEKIRKTAGRRRTYRRHGRNRRNTQRRFVHAN